MMLTGIVSSLDAQYIIHWDGPMMRRRSLVVCVLLVLLHCFHCNGEITSSVPTTLMPSAAPSYFNSIKAPPVTFAPVFGVIPSSPTSTPSTAAPIFGVIPTSPTTTPPTAPPTHTPTVVGTQDTTAPSPAPSSAPILNIVPTTAAPSTIPPTYTAATAAPVLVDQPRSNKSADSSTLLMAVLIPVASVAIFSLVILVSRRRRRRDPHRKESYRWNGGVTEPPLLGATGNNPSVFDDSSIYTRSSKGGGGSSSAGLLSASGGCNSVTGWIMPLNDERGGRHASITEEPTEESDTEDEDEPNQQERMEEGSSLYYYSNDTDTETSDSFLSGSTNPPPKSVTESGAVLKESPPSTSATGTFRIIGILKNSGGESKSKDIINSKDSNVEAVLMNYRGECGEGIQYDDIVGIDSNSLISGGEELKVNDQESSLYVSSDCSSTGLTSVSDAMVQPAAVLPKAVANGKSTGVHPLSFLKRMSKGAFEPPVATTTQTAGLEDLNMDYSVSADSVPTDDMPISSIMQEFNHYGNRPDDTSTIEPFSEITTDQDDHRSVGSDDAIVDASDMKLLASSHPGESSSCDSSAINVFETDNESNTSSRSTTRPSRLFPSNSIDWGLDLNVPSDPLLYNEDGNKNFEQLYESISGEWEWKEPSAISLTPALPPMTSSDSLTGSLEMSEGDLR